jgi:hypothetical protein
MDFIQLVLAAIWFESPVSGVDALTLEASHKVKEMP